ncbi:hypothetical protein [Abyssisolibacter fermentans]|uniref:hypothetical protein n=1 Tax=Abyssisolibacter fermentans TaxID=1766203 RepID=UPI0008342EDD|nr:hypothetical protein [Abyssisolibacter fermentans]
MDDNVNIENIIEEIRIINDNNFSNAEHVNNIELLLVSNNNGKVKDADIAYKFSDLKDKVEEIASTTNEMLESLGDYED